MPKNGTFCELRLYFFPLYGQKFRKKTSNHLTYTLILRYLPLKPNIFIILIAFYEIFRKHLFLLIFCTTLWKIGILTQNFDFFWKKSIQHIKKWPLIVYLIMKTSLMISEIVLIPKHCAARHNTTTATASNYYY